MKLNLLFIGIGLIILTTCHENSAENSTANSPAVQFYHNAQEKIVQKEYESTITLLRQALENGLENPMQIVQDSNFFVLIDNPKYRPEIRSLLEAFAIEHQAKMIRSDEEGEPIVVKGQIIDEANNEPLNNVKLELVHTDNDGYYFREKSTWNPRLFAYLITDDKGAFSISSIKPGRYKDDDGNDVPAHIHFTLKKEGYRVYASEFTFEDDSILIANGNIDNVIVAKLKSNEDQKQYQVVISMQRE